MNYLGNLILQNEILSYKMHTSQHLSNFCIKVTLDMGWMSLDVIFLRKLFDWLHFWTFPEKLENKISSKKFFRAFLALFGPKCLKNYLTLGSCISNDTLASKYVKKCVSWVNLNFECIQESHKTLKWPHLSISIMSKR